MTWPQFPLGLETPDGPENCPENGHQEVRHSGATPRPHTSPGQRPGDTSPTTPRAESPTQRRLNRAFSPRPFGERRLERCPRLVWRRAVGARTTDSWSRTPSIARSHGAVHNTQAPPWAPAQLRLKHQLRRYTQVEESTDDLAPVCPQSVNSSGEY